MNNQEQPFSFIVMRNIRKFMNMTQLQLAVKAGVDYSTLRKVETGKTGNPSFDFVYRISIALKMPMEWFHTSYIPMMTTTFAKPVSINVDDLTRACNALEDSKHRFMPAPVPIPWIGRLESGSVS